MGKKDMNGVSVDSDLSGIYTESCDFKTVCTTAHVTLDRSRDLNSTMH